MKPVEFPEVSIRIAETQDEFITIPAMANAKDGTVNYCMELTQEEIKKVQETGRIWVKQQTGSKKMQPMMFSVNKADIIPPIVDLGLSKNDGEVLGEELDNPSAPNENLTSAADKYKNGNKDKK